VYIGQTHEQFQQQKDRELTVISVGVCTHVNVANGRTKGYVRENMLGMANSRAKGEYKSMQIDIGIKSARMLVVTNLCVVAATPAQAHNKLYEQANGPEGNKPAFNAQSIGGSIHVLRQVRCQVTTSGYWLLVMVANATIECYYVTCGSCKLLKMCNSSCW
jgi:hypothetical protein